MAPSLGRGEIRFESMTPQAGVVPVARSLPRCGRRWHSMNWRRRFHRNDKWMVLSRGICGIIRRLTRGASDNSTHVDAERGLPSLQGKEHLP